MADTPENTETEKELNGWHRTGVFFEGVYDGGIAAVSSLGLIVDAANNLPRVLNVLPGVDGFERFHPRPALGSQMIYESLTGAHDAYKDLVLPEGATTFDPVDATDHIIYGGGYVTGAVAGTVATGAAANAALAAVTPATPLAVSSGVAAENTVGSIIGRQFLNSAGDPTLLGQGVNILGRGALTTGRVAGGFALRHPFLAAAGAAALDITQNGADLTTRLGKSTANFIGERVGIGPVFATESNPEGFAPSNLLQDPAKLAGMATVILAMNSVLNNFLGGPLGFIASLAIALTFHNLIGEKSNDLVNFARNTINDLTNPQNDRPQLSAPSPGP